MNGCVDSIRVPEWAVSVVTRMVTGPATRVAQKRKLAKLPEKQFCGSMPRPLRGMGMLKTIATRQPSKARCYPRTIPKTHEGNTRPLVSHIGTASIFSDRHLPPIHEMYPSPHPAEHHSWEYGNRPQLEFVIEPCFRGLEAYYMSSNKPHSPAGIHAVVPILAAQ